MERQARPMSNNLKQITHFLFKEYRYLKRKAFPYKPQEAIGPEHEFSIVDEQMSPLPIADKVIKDWLGKITESVYMPRYSFGKENVLHQMEIRARKPFRSPETFEETMHNAVLTLLDFLERRHHAQLLGTGMHPLLTIEETGLWNHGENLKTMQELDKIFNLKYQGWLNIQSFQLNIPYYNEAWGVALYNYLTHLCAYLPAISASSPICESKISPNVDGRLYYYGNNTKKIPSIAGEIVPEYITSFEQFRREVVATYLQDLSRQRVGERLLRAEWLNQRVVVFKFFRDAIELRVMDEQDCIKSDVALSCFIQATVRGLIARNEASPPHQLLVNDYQAIVKNGLKANVKHPHGKTAKEVCQYLLKIASEHADEKEKKYLWIINKRIEEGNLSNIIRKRVLARAQKTSFTEAVISIYSELAKALAKNQPYF
jgi:carboxylate-amine ligase